MPFDASTRTSDVCADARCENKKTYASANAAIEYFRILVFPFIDPGLLCLSSRTISPITRQAKSARIARTIIHLFPSMSFAALSASKSWVGGVELLRCIVGERV